MEHRDSANDADVPHNKLGVVGPRARIQNSNATVAEEAGKSPSAPEEAVEVCTSL